MSYDTLRVLAATDPRSARAALGAILDSGSDDLSDILTRASAPGEGRIRQLIANLARSRNDRDRVLPALLRWLELETDEFTRGSLVAATAGVDAAQWATPRRGIPDLVDTYRYVADRLCHRVRNALPSSLAQVERIAQAAEEAPEPARAGLLVLAARLKDEVRELGRIVEFDEGDEHFRWRRVVPMEWLPAYARAFSERNGSLGFRGLSEDVAAGSAAVMGTDFYLQTLFWNLFQNAQQAVANAATVTVHASLGSSGLSLTCTDNGPGFPESFADGAFEDRISTKDPTRGRGLLEVADAARRLSGSVRLVRDGIGVLRVQVTLPLAQL